jgi:hypothetical protein
MGVVVAVSGIDHQLPARHRHVDTDKVEPALMVVPVRRLDDDTAGCDAVIKGIQFRGFTAYPRFHRGRCFHAPERYLNWNLHGFPPYSGSKP